VKNVEQRRERLTADERRSRIVKAASVMFSQKGFAATRTKDIAKLAGISEPLLFQHFGTKRDLYIAVLEKLFEDRIRVGSPLVVQKMNDEDDFGVFKSMALMMIQHTKEEPMLPRLAMLSSLEGIDLQSVASSEKIIPMPIYDRLTTYIQSRMEKGAMRQMRPDLAARLLFGTIQMFILSQHTPIMGSPLTVDPEEAAQSIATVFLEGIKA